MDKQLGSDGGEELTVRHQCGSKKIVMQLESLCQTISRVLAAEREGEGMTNVDLGNYLLLCQRGSRWHQRTLIDPSPGEYCLVDSVYLFGEDKASLPVIDKFRRNMWSPSKQEKKLCSYKKMIFWHVYFFRCVFVCNGNKTAPQQVKTKFRWRGKM